MPKAKPKTRGKAQAKTGPKTKICTGCEKRRAVSKFGMDRRRKSGLRAQCVDCMSSARTESRKRKRVRDRVDTPEHLVRARRAAQDAEEEGFPMAEAVAREMIDIDQWALLLLAQLRLAQRSVTAARFIREQLTRVRTAELAARDAQTVAENPELRNKLRLIAGEMLKTKRGKARAKKLLVDQAKRRA